MILCEFIGENVCQSIKRCGDGKSWEVGIKDGFLKARINRDERDENLPREGEVTRGKVASSSNALSNKDC